MRLLGNFGLNKSILACLQNTDGAIWFDFKEDTESVTYFFFGCSYFKNNFESLSNELKLEISESNPTEGVYIFNFIERTCGANPVGKNG